MTEGMLKIRMTKIIRTLQKKYKVRMWRERPFRVLIACVLSQRTKDETTDRVATALLAQANTPQKMVKLGRTKIAKIIRSANYYKGKAKRIFEISRILLKKYKGRMPRTRDELMELPGVGAKTASIVLAYAFGVPTIAVDTHVNRISKRLGFVAENSKPEKTQEAIEKIIPKKYQIIANHLLVEFGKEICQPRVPRCYACQIVKLCPYPNKNLKV